MSEFSWEKCYVIVIGPSGIKVRAAKMHLGDSLIKAKMHFFTRKTVTFVIPPHAKAHAFKKKVAWIIDGNTGLATDANMVGVIDDETKAVIKLVGRDKFFRFLGGRDLSMWEELFRLFAGYGIFRLTEFALLLLFGE